MLASMSDAMHEEKKCLKNYFIKENLKLVRIKETH